MSEGVKVAEYLKAFLAELERLKPGWGVTSHGVALDLDDGGLILLVVCGDCVLPCVLSSDDLIDDPVAAAQALWLRVSQALDDPNHRTISYKT